MQMTMTRREPLKHVAWPDWSDLRERLEAILKLQGRGEWAPFLVREYLPPLPVLYNWAPLYRTEREEFRRGGAVFKETSERALVLDWIESDVDPEEGPFYTPLVTCTLPGGVEAFLTVFVTAADLTPGRDLDRVRKPVKRLVREAIEHCPTPAEAPGMLLAERPLVHTEAVGPWTAFHIAISGLKDVDVIVLAFTAALREALNKPRPPVGVVPPEWQELLRREEQSFLKDLRRYDLYLFEGYNARQIAYLEEQRRLNKPVHARPSNIGHEVPNESSVWESLDRIHYAVTRERLRLRRERLDKPAKGAPPYSCETPGHGGGRLCPKECPTWQRYHERIERRLPTDSTGQEQAQLAARFDKEWERWWTEGKFRKPEPGTLDETCVPSVLDQQVAAEEEAEGPPQEPDPTRAARYEQARRLLDALPRKTRAILWAHFVTLRPFRAGEREKAGEAIRQLRDALVVKVARYCRGEDGRLIRAITLVPYPPTDGSRCAPGGCGCPLPRDWFSYNYRGFIDRTKGYRHLPEVKELPDPSLLPNCPRCGRPQDRANCSKCEHPVERPETT